MAINKDFFPTGVGEVAPLIVVYQSDKDLWKGFVNPYGETVEAVTKEEAVEKMRDLTAAYKETAEEYGNPKHLVYAGLGDILDREVFSFVVNNKELMKEFSNSGKVDLDNIYVEAYRDQS